MLLGLLPLTGAAEPFAGNLIAERDCPAGVSTKHQGNPGQVRLVPGETYPVVGRNRAEPTHYLLRIESAQPQDRWVEVGCGRLAAAAPPVPEASAEPQPRGVAPAGPGAMDAQFVLAASWQPAFCESRRRRPDVPDRPRSGWMPASSRSTGSGPSRSAGPTAGWGGRSGRPRNQGPGSACRPPA